MSEMIIKTLWGQMAESYEGEHAPELLCAVDEWTLEDNAAYFEKEKKRVLADGYDKNFISIKEIDIVVDQDAIRSLLLQAPQVKGSVVLP